jgi:hypothetical protein
MNNWIRTKLTTRKLAVIAESNIKLTLIENFVLNSFSINIRNKIERLIIKSINSLTNKI